MSKITRLAISRKLIDQNKNKKKLFWTTYSYTFLPILRSKFKIPNATEAGLLFDISKIGT